MESVLSYHLTWVPGIELRSISVLGIVSSDPSFWMCLNISTVFSIQYSIQETSKSHFLNLNYYGNLAIAIFTPEKKLILLLPT